MMQRSFANPPFSSYLTIRRDAIKAAIDTLASNTIVGFGSDANRYIDDCFKLTVHSYKPVLTLSKIISDRRVIVSPINNHTVDATTFISYNKAIGGLQSISAEQCYECVKSSLSPITELDLGILQHHYFPLYHTLIPIIAGVACEELLKKSGMHGTRLLDSLKLTLGAVACLAVGSFIGPGMLPAVSGFAMYKIMHTIIDVAKSCLSKQRGEKKVETSQLNYQKHNCLQSPVVVKRAAIKRIEVASTNNVSNTNTRSKSKRTGN